MAHETSSERPSACDERTALRNLVADAVLETRSDAIIACDRDGLIQLWNPGASRIFGFAAHEAMGRSLDIIIPDRLQARHWEGYRRMMSSGESRYDEGHVLSVPGRRKDGSPVSVEFTIVALRDGQAGVSHLIAVLRDVTVRFEEMKRLRAQLRASS